jgi:hypothetical protein
VKEFTAEELDAFRSMTSEKVYELFVSMHPPEFKGQLDFMLLRGFRIEAVFELPSAASIPTVIKEVTISALRWRKEQLVLAAKNN